MKEPELFPDGAEHRVIAPIAEKGPPGPACGSGFGLPATALQVMFDATRLQAGICPSKPDARDPAVALQKSATPAQAGFGFPAVGITYALTDQPVVASPRLSVTYMSFAGAWIICQLPFSETFGRSIGTHADD